MSVKSLNQEKYSSDYNHFFNHNLWPFIVSFLNTTDNVSRNRQYFLAGNGASAAIASHLANDMTKALGCRARTFHDPAHITCFSNDFGYEEWLAESIYKFVDEDDVVILISSSGKSKNILNAAKAAVQRKAILVALTGPRPEQKLVTLANCCLSVDSDVYNIVECCHMVALTAAIDSVNMITIE